MGINQQKGDAIALFYSMKFNSKQAVADYINHDKIECLECGNRYSFLPVHIRRAHGLTANDYRERYNLPASTPLAGLSYRAAHRDKINRMAADGRLTRDHLADASEKARTAGRGNRRDFDLAEQAKRASLIPHEQLPSGAKKADGRDADRAREYQRIYRRQKMTKLSRNPSFTPSPKLRGNLESRKEGTTERLNHLGSL